MYEIIPLYYINKVFFKSFLTLKPVKSLSNCIAVCFFRNLRTVGLRVADGLFASRGRGVRQLRTSCPQLTDKTRTVFNAKGSCRMSL